MLKQGPDPIIQHLTALNCAYNSWKKMTWTFKDRYNPDRKVIINNDFPQLLKILDETFLDFKYYNSLSTPAQKELIKNKGIIFAKSIYIHTQISYCLGTHNCQEDHLYNSYCTTVKELSTNVHPMFAMKKYADYISFIRNENETTTEKTNQNCQHNNSKKSNIIFPPPSIRNTTRQVTHRNHLSKCRRFQLKLSNLIIDSLTPHRLVKHSQFTIHAKKHSKLGVITTSKSISLE